MPDNDTVHRPPPPPAPRDIADDVRRALREDLGAGDLTAALIGAQTLATARVISRESAVLCGVPWFEEVFRQLDAQIRVSWKFADGDRVELNQVLCQLHGRARPILSGERTALNFLQLLSGTATLTRHFVDAIQGTDARILDTRKTIPGLRFAQKYAVRCGGGSNHRMGLYDAVLIKENHILAAGSIGAAVQNARALAPPDTPVEIEVETLQQLREALAAGTQRLLLDNFDVAGLRAAVQETRGRARLEASGGVTLQSVRAIAETGVDDISIGNLTKSPRSIDLSMRFDELP
ncbi:MAG: carboxylating nicotinate-nucleotide diphosphorylase [Acidiferrobacterales bacterium]